MSDSILITTGARLHFGFFAHGGAGARPAGATNYGGIGLMIDSPGFVLEASVSPGRDRAPSSPESRLDKFERQYRECCPSDWRPPPCQINLRNAIPLHRGLGAGTQLGMAVAKGLSLLAGETEVDAVTLAQRVGRGARSAIGIHGFERGGFLIDAGKLHNADIGVLESRTEVPAAWRFLLLNPPGNSAGLSGPAEVDALGRLSAIPASMTERLRRSVSAEMLPALAAGDCNRFGEALFQFGQAVGEYFRPIQGGTYATPLSGDLVTWIRVQGFSGVAQSSWGPTLAVCCPDQQSADLLAAKIAADPRWRDCRTQIARPLNTGAKIESSEGRRGFAQ
jgi:beta-ribofuranosylaminobenzene 5'-phosphate synthase